MMVRITGRETVYDGWTTVHRLTLTDGTQTFTREVEDHGVAVGVLPYDPERRTVLLVRMPRAPVMLTGNTDILEVPAGLIEPGEEPEAAARREAAEEAGVALAVLEPVGTFWTCPGVSTERITLFLARYGATDRIAAGGGLPEENENISVIEMPIIDLLAPIQAGEAVDLRVYALLQVLRLRHPELF